MSGTRVTLPHIHLYSAARRALPGQLTRVVAPAAETFRHRLQVVIKLPLQTESNSNNQLLLARAAPLGYCRVGLAS